MKDFGLLLLRLTLGTLMAGHGSQKLFGWFKGPGLQGTQGFMEQLGMRPGQVWGTMAALGEFSGGLLTGLGFLSPLGPLNIAAAMAVAARRVHWKLPVWASEGGAELPLVNMAAALALATIGPGRFSLDNLFGLRLPAWSKWALAAITGAVTYFAVQKPEVAEKALNVVSNQTRQVAPDLEMETRSNSQTEQQTQPQQS